MDMVQVILLAITGNTLLLAVLGWLARSLIQNMFAKDLSTHRIRLEAENERVALEFGHELSLAAKEHDIRFGKLHERRADTIAKLYELLADTIAAILQRTSSTGLSRSRTTPQPHSFSETRSFSQRILAPRSKSFSAQSKSIRRGCSST